MILLIRFLDLTCEMIPIPLLFEFRVSQMKYTGQGKK